LVYGYCGDNDDPEDDVLDRIADFELGAAARDGLHEKGAGERAEYSAAAAAQLLVAQLFAADHAAFVRDLLAPLCRHKYEWTAEADGDLTLNQKGDKTPAAKW
jgi:hypothetical protein